MLVALMLLLGDRLFKIAALKFPPLSADFFSVEFGFAATRTTNVLGMVELGSTAAVVLVSVVFLALFVWSFSRRARSPYTLYSIPYTLILLGGASNLYDRLTTGAVTDVFRIAVPSHALVFNLADGMIVFGVIALGMSWQADRRE